VFSKTIPEYQIFITTYDKPWYEHARGIHEQLSAWKTLGFYARASEDDTKLSILFDDQASRKS